MDVEIKFTVFTSAEVNNVSVAKFEQVFGLTPRHLLVIDVVGADIGDLPANAHNRFAEGVQAFHFISGDEQGEGDDRVDAFSDEEVVKQGLPLRWVVGQAVEGEVIACPNQCGFDSIDHFAVEPAVHKGCEQGNIL